MRRLGFAIVTLGIIGLLGSGCGGGSEEPASPAEPAPAPAEPAPESAPEPAPATTPPPAPAPAPTTGGTPDAQAGAPLYATYCSSCHGATGGGDGPVSAGLNPKPARHNDAAYMNPLSDEHLFEVVKGGGPAVGKSPLMTPWGGTLSDEQIWDVVAFIRTLAD